MAPAACYIGTSGWSYPKGEGTWQGFFYPPVTKDELAYYSRSFDTVEVNSSFYRPPSPKTAKSWDERTPADFRFSNPQIFCGELAIIEFFCVLHSIINEIVNYIPKMNRITFNQKIISFEISLDLSMAIFYF